MGDQDCDCKHEEVIILMKDHVKDIGEDTKKILKILQGNGDIGLITKQALQEQSISRMQKYQLLTLGAIITGAVKMLWYGG